ncbi:pSAM2 Replication initiator protein [Streptomyces ambofaciens ATCC 23877]|uniref:Replication initiator protein n=3 Tax=Streptomyces ambofaciens TaxID=1889 RepID=REPS_STRAM|nr:replication initiator protein RepSA [Streptomyces ambofaciens]P36891.1 RecName: Full=Replication initiator protein [Streptomyces ambofaciens]AKZ57120.1 pSAM2 Replication initiator protein [Streptomyces ambofaciens ATCC 23877]CAA06459.1 RepSA [Streptomyces ambofaciens]CAA79648.1 RepSA [Streptomyces ambofaciens]
MPDTLLDPTTLGDLLRVASAPDYARWEDQIRRTGAGANPIHLTGWTLHKDKTTGETLHHYTTAVEPGGRLRLACGNRRASRCPSCAWTYAGDTYHLIRAGLAGDDRRDIPATVRDHPRVFATLTAPSFGPVHNRPDHGTCRCGTRHAPDAPELGAALDPTTYDYAGAVLFNNHAGQLWQRFTTRLRREIAARAGLSRRELPDCLRVSYGKVAEFQKRGALHFHAVIRLDGPEGPDTTPPAWATVALLADAIRAAAAHSYTSVSVPAAEDQPARTFRWGTQLDVRPVKAFGDGSDITEQAVASYVAKYATKAAENTGTLDRRIGELSELDRHDVPDHTRRLVEACKMLDPLYPERRLWAWAHMLGFRGHFSSKSRRYSTTLGALRQARADYRAAQEHAALALDDREPDTVLVLADWQYAGHGHTPGESVLAATIARNLQLNRETAREAVRDQLDQEGVAA